MSSRRVSTKELSELTGLSTYQIQLGMRKGTIPYIRLGRRLLFDPDMVEKALEFEAEKNQQEAREKYAEQQPKEVVYYGELRDLLD